MTDHLAPLPVDQWDASLAPIADDMQGAPLHVHGMMAHNPALLTAWWGLRNHAVRGGTLGDRLGELVILRTAMHLGAWYEWASHLDRALRLGMDLPEITRVACYDTGHGWTGAEAALLRAVDELFENRRLSPALRQQLELHFTAPQVLDLMAITGMYQILGTLLGSWDTPLDPDVAGRVAAHARPDDFARSCAAFHAARQAG